MENNKIFENRYNKVVEQNRSLQRELKEKALQINWNIVDDIYFGEFGLKRHSWCHSLNTANTVGFIDVEYIADKHRRIYVGIGGGYDFNADVLNIAKYGTCIKDADRASKWCPKCERITSCSSMPNYCAWGCGSLADEPILPDYSEWTRLGGYNGVVDKERQTKKEDESEISEEEIPF